MKLRNISKMNQPNDGKRALFESILSHEVIDTLTDWNINYLGEYILMGDLALSYYIKPRFSNEIEILLIDNSVSTIKVDTFEQLNEFLFRHIKTNIIIKLVTNGLLKLPKEIYLKVIETAQISDKIKITSPFGIVALKIESFNLQNKADIGALLQLNLIDLKDFEILKESSIEKYKKLKTFINGNIGSKNTN